MSDDTPRRQVTVSVSAKATPVKYSSVEVFCSASLPLGEGESVRAGLLALGEQVRYGLVTEIQKAVAASAPYLRAYQKVADGKPLTDAERALFKEGE